MWALTHPLPNVPCSPSLNILAQRNGSGQNQQLLLTNRVYVTCPKPNYQSSLHIWLRMTRLTIYKFSSYFQRWFEARFSKPFGHLDMQQFRLVSIFFRGNRRCSPALIPMWNPGPVQVGFSHHLLFILSNALSTVLAATTCCSALSCLPDFAVCLKWLRSYLWLLHGVNAVHKSEEKEAYILPYSG